MTDHRPSCPFCAAPWSDAMIAELGAMSSPCSCCGGPADVAAAEPLPMPSGDLCCATCGRAIYLNPHAAP
jgi:hypothetical protein